MLTRGAVWDGQQLIVTEELEVRALWPGEVLVRVEVSGVCHSDANVIDGSSPRAFPVVLGHEAAGVIEAVAEDAHGRPRHRVGARVMVSSMRPCHACAACDDGRPGQCREAFGGDQAPFSWRGQPVRSYASVSSFAHHIVVRGDQVIELPDSVSTAAGALVGCAITTGYGSVHNVAKVQTGQRVAVLGIGGIGSAALQACRAAYATQIVAVDRDPAKETSARRFGATDMVTVEDPSNLADQLRALAPDGFDAVFECTGSLGAIETAIDLLAPGGMAVLIGIPPRGTRAAFDVNRLFDGRRIAGAYNGAIAPHRDIPAILELAERGVFDLDALVTARFPLAQIDDALAALRSGRELRVVLDH
jgi:Zn-dependent alcohol dehydrogenase